MACHANPDTSSSDGIDILSCDCYPGYEQIGEYLERSCSLCPSGKYSHRYSGTAAPTCKTCNGVDSTSPEGSNDVSDCVCGLGVLGFDCSSCVLGTYRKFSGNGICVACPENTYTKKDESTEIADCLCLAGYTKKDPTTCVACAIGSYKDTLSDSVCTTCPNDQTTNRLSVTQSRDCICNAGQFYKPRDIRCDQVISLGRDFFCAIVDGRHLKCWGAAYGIQVQGDLRYNAGEMRDNLPTINLGIEQTVIAVAAGREFICALLDTKRVKCWGMHYHDQLGWGYTDGHYQGK